MPKTYRTQPLAVNLKSVKGDNSYGLPVLHKRARVATKRLAEYVRRLDGDFIYEAAVEIGLDECLQMDDENKRITFDLTELQLISLAAALGALVELRDSAKV